jgi:2,4-dienoyl-CoA reductase-like NADH-dependent reductase (Old Yellow Enzyme family)
MPSLFDSLKIGDLMLPNRVIMSPLTRLRADAGHLPNDLMATYYAQRASAGLVITEGVPVSPQGVGYVGVAGVWSKDQVTAWQRVTAAAKRSGGRIFMQLWHVGRISDASLLNGQTPVGASALAAKGNVSRLRPERPSGPARPGNGRTGWRRGELQTRCGECPSVCGDN